MVRPTLINMDPVGLKYHPFMISLNKSTGSCNVLSPKICVPNMITSKNEAKAMTEHTSCDCICTFNSTTRSSQQNRNNKICQCECKNYRKCKKDYILES